MRQNNAFVRFYREFFTGTDQPLDSPQVFFKLIEEINKLKMEVEKK